MKFRLCSKMLSKEPFNRALHDKFIKARSEYKKECRKAEKYYGKYLTNKINNLGHNDPTSFWKIIKKMNNWGKGKNNPEDGVPPQIWRNHFKQLLVDKNLRQINSNLKTGYTFDPLLDGRITEKELEGAVRKLKCGKAVGPDGILSEYLTLKLITLL